MQLKAVFIATAALALAFGLGYVTGQGAYSSQSADFGTDFPQNSLLNSTATGESPPPRNGQLLTKKEANNEVPEQLISTQEKTPAAEEIKQQIAAQHHAQQQKKFRHSERQDQQSWQFQQQLQDYFQLYSQPESVELIQVSCDQSQCQFVGNFAGSARQWSELLDEMKQQGWWDFTGTSSHSESDSKHSTSFVVFASKTPD